LKNISQRTLSGIVACPRSQDLGLLKIIHGTTIMFLFFLAYLTVVSGFRLPPTGFRRSVVAAIPLELEGQLDEKKSWEVKFVFQGVEKVCKVPESMSLLEMGESIFDGVESSCRNGICTTCAARVIEGQDQTKLAVHGIHFYHSHCIHILSHHDLSFYRSWRTSSEDGFCLCLSMLCNWTWCHCQTW
jgi:hypothetical protein